MKLAHIQLCKLSVSKANMRYARRAPDVSDILPSIRKRGVIVPVIVRPNGSDETFEIVAGARRFHAAQIVRDETDIVDPMPCAIMEAGDYAAALEASLIENTQRLDADEVTQWATFTRLVVKEGRTIEDISATFGLPPLAVRRILALGNLLPRIRALYGAGKIDAATIRPLTLATRDKQKEWLALYDDADAYAPSGAQVKAWLFGGASISTKAALFDLASYEGEIATDLFGEGGYFADPAAFWTAQEVAIEVRRAAYLEAGWREVVVLPQGQHFDRYDHEQVGREDGGRVYATVNQRGEVAFHEGYLTRREAKKIAAGGTVETAKPTRPEVSGPMQTYIDLHRHAATRAALLDHPGVAMRLMVAHAVVGSPLWTVRAERQYTSNPATAESVETCAGEGAFDQRRCAVLALLGFDPERPTVAGGNGSDYDLTAVFVRLLALPDTSVSEVIGIVIGETLAAGSAVVEAVGLEIGVKMGAAWQADAAFFELIRDREMLSHIVADVAGDIIARSNAGEKAKVLKGIVRDHLAGTNGRIKVEGWVPRWMAFPPSAYTARGGIGTVNRHERIADLIAAQPEPEPPVAGGTVEVEATRASEPERLAA